MYRKKITVCVGVQYYLQFQVSASGGEGQFRNVYPMEKGGLVYFFEDTE